MATRHSNDVSLIPAVGYLRMSSDKQEASIPAQRDAVEQYAKLHHYIILEWYIDEGISGDDTAKRKSFQRMIAAAEKRKFQAILCWDQDRFGRFDSIEAGRWIYPLRQNGVRLDTVAQGVVDWSDFTSRMMYGITQEAKHSFLRDLSRNVCRGHLAKAKLGLWQGGPPPYGYLVVDGRLVENPLTAPIVRRIFTDYAVRGLSLRGIAEQFNKENIPSPGGKKWRYIGIHKMLSNDVYAGTYSWSKNTNSKYNHATADGVIEGPSRKAMRGYRNNASYPTIEDNHPAMVSRETFDKVQAAFAQRKRDTSAWKHEPYPLTGLCRCGHCGNTLIGTVMNRKYPNHIYVCGGYNQSGSAVCNRNYVYEKQMLNCLLRKVEEKALAPHNQERLRESMRKQLTAKQVAAPADEGKALQARLAKLEKEITQGADRLLKAPEDLHDMLIERLRAWRTERDELRRQLDAHKPQERVDARQAEEIINAAIAKLTGLRERLHDADPAKLRLALREVIDRTELFFDQQPYGTRTKSEFKRGVIYLRGELFNLVSQWSTTG